MLEGMAPAQARAVRADRRFACCSTPRSSTTPSIAAAIAYLSRRLDENAAEENFLRVAVLDHARLARVGGRARDGSTRRSRRVPRSRRCRAVSRTAAPNVERSIPTPSSRTSPTPTSRSPANREWIAHHLAASAPPGPAAAAHRHRRRSTPSSRAPSRPRASVGQRTSAERAGRVLTRVPPSVMAAHRGRTIAVMAHETGKTVREGDPEVSEAHRHGALGRHPDARPRRPRRRRRAASRRVGVGAGRARRGTSRTRSRPTACCSALAAGNAVILKPAPEAVATAVELVAPAPRGRHPDRRRAARALPRRRRRPPPRRRTTAIDTVVLTGAYDTAQMFLDWKPQLRLIAETSGKNALVITGGADLDLAIRDLVRSAFGHAGQKCSAASLAIVEVVAATTTRASSPGSPTRCAACASVRAADLATMIGPVIDRAERQAAPRADATRRGRALARRAASSSTRRAGCGARA